VFAGGRVERLAMAQAKSGEDIGQAEFEAFYARTSRKLHGYLCRLSRDPATADEVLQESYIRLINAPVPPAKELPRIAYLYRIATNLLRDRWRRRKRENEWAAMANRDERIHQDFNLPIDMDSVFESLGAQERAMLWLAHVDELNHKEIGAILGVKEKSVKVMLFRAREKARDLLERAGIGITHE
jgi:RNA polymerase sigma-70 factor (ECF subfamily)